jgi:hypothetical protein
VELDAEIDRLYGVPLDEFVRCRDELAKRLRGEGEREAAERVKALRKPTTGAWALNLAVRRRRRETGELLAAGERLRAAHEALLSGGDPAALREAMQDERILASTLADCAEAIASESGKSGPALRERVRSTLHAATIDEEAREELATGRFVREREAAGLGPFGTAPEAAPPRRAKRGRRPDAKSAARDRPAKSARAAAERDRRAAKRDRSAAERDRSAPRDGPAAERARRAAERELAGRVAEAERLLGEAGSALERAQAAHSSAAGELEAARQALREADSGERAARKLAREQEREVAKRQRELERLRARRPRRGRP